MAPAARGKCRGGGALAHTPVSPRDRHRRGADRHRRAGVQRPDQRDDRHHRFRLFIIGGDLGLFVWLFRAGTWTATERKQLIAIAVLFVGASVFWSLFEQAGSTLNLFAQRNTDNAIFGFSFPSSWWQSLNSLYIILLAPLFAWLWLKLGAKDPSSPAKFAIGLFFAAAGFGVLAVAAQLAETGVRVSPLWLITVYLLHTLGELCLSPIGLSAMTRLAPARIAGLMMGAWFLATSVGNYLGGQIASLYESFALPTLFTAITVIALIATVAMALLVRPLARMLAQKPVG